MSIHRLPANNIKAKCNLFYGNLHGTNSRTIVVRILLRNGLKSCVTKKNTLLNCLLRAARLRWTKLIKHRILNVADSML